MVTKVSKPSKHNFTWQVRADKRLTRAFTSWAKKNFEENSGVKTIGGISTCLNDLLYNHLTKVGAAPEVDPQDWRPAKD